MGILRTTSWRSCRGIQCALGRWALELWYLPSGTHVIPHYHSFDSWFIKIFGTATINKTTTTKTWGWFDLHIYSIEHGASHWLKNYRWPLIFLNVQKHAGAVRSAGDDFQET
jgi:hypothetical protein